MTVAELEGLRMWFKSCVRDHAWLKGNAVAMRRLRGEWEWLAGKSGILTWEFGKKLAWDAVNAVADEFPRPKTDNDLVLTGDPAPVVREKVKKERPRREDARQGRLL